MNKQRRKEIEKCITILNNVKKELDILLNQEQNAFDNMSDGLQCTMRGQESEDSIDYMETSIDNIDKAIDELSYI